MHMQVIESTKNEISLSLTDSDIGTLYIVQQELLKDPSTKFAGVVVKHPLTNEQWMRFNTTKTNPTGEIVKAADAAIRETKELQKVFSQSLKQ